MISLSDMRNRIQILKATTAMDEVGNRENSYASYCVRWAYVNRQSGSESYRAGVTHEEERLYFVVRFDSKTRLITAGEYRIEFGGKTYDITSVDNFRFKNKTLTLYAKEIS